MGRNKTLSGKPVVLLWCISHAPIDSYFCFESQLILGNCLDISYSLPLINFINLYIPAKDIVTFFSLS